ncbi:MAG: hypothetical protein JWQ73_564, partial [Variovorax sp.]|nr:hypothetical protein [Variovorax sp.]
SRRRFDDGVDMTFFRLLMPLPGNTPRSAVLNTVQ